MKKIDKNWQKYNLNFKIFLVLGVACFITSGLFYFSMDLYLYIYDPNWNGIFSEKESQIDRNLIFLLGASNVYSIDVDDISKEFTVNGVDYEIYDLADMSDTPTRRINSLTHLIELSPKIIVYGISMTDFEKPIDYQNRFFEYNFWEYAKEPNEFFRNLFSYLIDSDFSEKFPTAPKDRMIQSIKYIIRGPDYPTHPFINYNKNEILPQDEIDTIYKQKIGFRGIDTDDRNDELIALNKIIKKFQANGIKVLIFTPPYNELFFESVNQKDLNSFNAIMEEISEKHDIDVLYLHERYAEKEIWRDPYHVAINDEAMIYTDDIKTWLMAELKE